MWFASWEQAARCRNQKDVKEELAEECEMCLLEGSKVPFDAWSTPPGDEEAEDSESTVESLPESSTWSKSSEDDNYLQESPAPDDKDTRLEECADSAQKAPT